jgi:hypothetical protein
MSALVLRRLFAVAAAACIVAVHGAAWSLVENFNNPPDARWTLYGNATYQSDTLAGQTGYIQLTPNVDYQTGAIFFTAETFSTAKFDAEFDIYLGAATGGADGAVFAFVRAPGVGDGGGQMGFLTGLDGYGIEFDTYPGKDDTAGPEPDGNHIGVSRAAPVRANAAALEAWTLPHPLENDSWYHVEVLFESGTVNVWMSNTTIPWARTQVITNYVIPDWVDYDAYFGVTGATGGAINVHAVTNFALNKGATAPSDFRVYGGDLVTLTGSGPENYTTATWSQVGGQPAVTLTPVPPLSAQFTAPSLEIGTILTFRFTMTTPDTGTTYADVNVTVTAVNPPKPPPSNIRVRPLDLGSAGLGFRTSWDPLIDAEQYDIGLELAPGSYFWIETIAVNTYDVKGLTAGQTRTIAIRGRNKHGGSDDPASMTTVTGTGMRNLARPVSLGGTSEPSDYVYAVSHYAITG